MSGIGGCESEVDGNCCLVTHLWAGGARRMELKAVHLWVSHSIPS